MHWQYTPYVWPLLASAALSAVPGIYAWHHRTVPGATPFSLTMLLVVVWSVANALEVAGADLATKIFWANLQYLSYAAIPVTWLATALEYTGRDRWLTVRRLAWLLALPAITVLLVWTNDLHGLMRYNVHLDTTGLFPVVGKTYGPWFWVHSVYAYTLLLVSMLLLVETLPRTPHPYRGQTASLLIAMLLPLVWNVLYVFGIGSVRQPDLTPLVFGISGVVMALAIFRYRLFTIVPVAHEKIIRGMNDGVIVLDDQNRIVDLNPAAQEIFGKAACHALGLQAAQLFSAWPKLVEICYGQAGARTELVLGGRSATRHYEVHLSPLGQQRGGTIGQVLVLHDITERKRVEDALRDSERRYRELADSLPETVFEMDVTGRLTFVNRAAFRQFGYSQEDFDKGINVADTLAPEDRDRAVNNVVEVLAGRLPEPKQYTALRKDGTTFPCLVSANRVVRGGVPVGLRGFLVDISTTKQAERALRESEERFRRLAENAEDIIYRQELSPSLRMSYVSPAVRRVLGYTPEELCADPELSLRIVHPEDRPLLEARLTGEERSVPVIIRWVRKDGQIAWLEHRSVPICDADGKPVAIEGIARDITERKRAEEALQEVNARLAERVDELERRNQEASILNEMGDLFQSCISPGEAYGIVARSAQKLFPGDSGSLFVLQPSRNLAEPVATWGGSPSTSPVFTPDECWALRRGKLHAVSDAASGLLCEHLSNPIPASYMCVPMIVQGETLGVLHLGAAPAGAGRPDGSPAWLTESKQRLAVTMTEHVALALANLRLREILRDQATRDPLTGLFNRRYMEETLEREVRRSTRKGRKLALLMLDMDNFKRINDLLGHEAGDALLAAVGGYLRTHVRQEDIACRYGGDELVVILPETPLEMAIRRAEELREGIKLVTVEHRNQTLGPETVSLGVAAFPEHGTTGEDLLRSADAALYRAKAGGRDRVEAATEADA